MKNNVDYIPTEYAQVGATGKNCLKVLPFASKKNQQCTPQILGFNVLIF